MSQGTLAFAITITEYSSAIAINAIGKTSSKHSMICPSCLMFGSHKGHDVCRIEDGSRDLRKAINNSAK